jgi:hypothetical protein
MQSSRPRFNKLIVVVVPGVIAVALEFIERSNYALFLLIGLVSCALLTWAISKQPPAPDRAANSVSGQS